MLDKETLSEILNIIGVIKTLRKFSFDVTNNPSLTEVNSRIKILYLKIIKNKNLIFYEFDDKISKIC